MRLNGHLATEEAFLPALKYGASSPTRCEWQDDPAKAGVLEVTPCFAHNGLPDDLRLPTSMQTTFLFQQKRR